MTWQTPMVAEALQARGTLLQDIRLFFAERGVLEVDTPVLMPSVNNDPFIHAFSLSDKNTRYFLQTSPEFAMKRLMACLQRADIYYLGKAFRYGESGSKHNPEFSILEWYRLGFSLDDLMNEVATLLQQTLGAPDPIVCSYAELFEAIGINPHQTDRHQLAEFAKDNRLGDAEQLSLDETGWLEWIFYHAIESKLDKDQLIFVHEFPLKQAQLAKHRSHHIYGKVAERFEVYYQGFELANGYDELTCAKEQQARFVANNQKRQQEGLDTLPVDSKLIKALTHGLPQMSGVAMGVDRLLMIQLNCNDIKEVLAFPFESLSSIEN